MLNIRDFQNLIIKRSQECFTECNDWTASDWAMAFIGELGELYNCLKKLKRDQNKLSVEEMKELKENIKMEFGDALSYLVLIASKTGYDLEDCAIAAFNKVSKRKGYSMITENTDNLTSEENEVKITNVKKELTMNERIDLQNKEYNALQDLITAYQKGILRTAVVDDTFPEVKHKYESAMKSFIDVIKANGRI